MSNALKADHVIHRVTFNPKSPSPGEVLRVPVPKLDNGVVLVPGSLALIFNLTVSEHANNFFVNNVSRALVDRLTLKFAGEIVQDTDGYDLFKLWEDLFLTKNERANMFREGIQSEDLSKIKCNAGDKKTSGVDKENKLNEVYRNIYRIPLDHDILKDHGVFFARALSDELLFEFRLPPADKGSDTIINESINVPRRSMKGLLLFYETYTAGTRNSEKTFNPNITDVKLTVDGIQNKTYSQGMKARDIWEKVFRRFGKENSPMNATDFYAGNRFGLFIDLRSMRDNDLHGLGLRLVNTKDGVHLANNRKGSGSGNVKCHIFILSDAQLNIVNRELESVTY
ncbi:hypothetical protein AWC38_SpisGene2097 [Stylophora pistillata]|uniref:Uncharacterized protein n=1 Tax=Stylophora pistillata TaxID=50429 RepID=A0A2B4SX52_STYPI|nr:hypothetical protein AWC38_SpisGene2097 [Stylophora pistillata]